MEKQAAFEKIAQVRAKMMLQGAYEAGVRDGMEKKAFIGRAWKSITGQTAAENRVAGLEQQRQGFLKDRYQDPNRTFEQRGRDYDASQNKTDVSNIQGPHLRGWNSESYDPDVQQKNWGATNGGVRREMARRKRLGIENTPRGNGTAAHGGKISGYWDGTAAHGGKISGYASGYGGRLSSDPSRSSTATQEASTGTTPQPNATPWPELTEQESAHHNHRQQHKQGHRGITGGEYLRPGDPGRRDAYLTREEQDTYDLQKAHEYLNSMPPYENLQNPYANR